MENTTLTVKPYVLGYLDILGHTEALSHFKSESINFGNSRRELLDKGIEAAIMPVYLFNREIKEQFKNLRKMVKSKMFDYDLETRYFSDNAVVYSSLNEDIGHVPTGSIYLLFGVMGLVHFKMMSSGIFVRGGIDYGFGVEIDNNVPNGDALLSAYELESKVADYPRIVVGEKLIRYLEYRYNINGKSRERMIEKSVIEKCRNMLIVDGGQNTIDIFSTDFLNLYKEHGLLVQIQSIRGEIAWNLQNQTKNEVKDKYAKLRTYMDKFIPPWEK